MAWVNSGYMNEATDELRLAGARAFHAEITAKIGADVSADGSSRSSGSLLTLLQQVKSEIDELEAKVGRAKRGRIYPARIAQS